MHVNMCVHMHMHNMHIHMHMYTHNMYMHAHVVHMKVIISGGSCITLPFTTSCSGTT